MFNILMDTVLGTFSISMIILYYLFIYQNTEVLYFYGKLTLILCLTPYITYIRINYMKVNAVGIFNDDLKRSYFYKAI